MSYILNRTYTGVCVKHIKKNYLLTDETGQPLTGVKQGTLLKPLDEGAKVMANGEIIKPSGEFFVTMETIDPYHIILDIQDRSVLTFTVR